MKCLQVFAFFRYNVENDDPGGKPDASEATWASNSCLRQSEERSIPDVDVCVLYRRDAHRYGNTHDATRTSNVL